MVCGGFTCSRNALIALNTLYIVIALILIIIPSVAKSQAYVSSLYVVGGIIACGIFLLLVSILGLIGAIRHHQVCLFFYMVILFFVFLLEFFISVACLAVSEKRKEQLVESSWNSASDQTKKDIQNGLCCCGFNANDTALSTCPTSDRCLNMYTTTVSPSSTPSPALPHCQELLENIWSHGLRYCGGLGLFFSFTEICGVIYTYRYRNQKDPRANPNAFL